MRFWKDPDLRATKQDLSLMVGLKKFLCGSGEGTSWPPEIWEEEVICSGRKRGGSVSSTGGLTPHVSPTHDYEYQ